MYTSKPEASAFFGQQLCKLTLSRYHLWQTVQLYAWLCVTLLCRGLASASAAEHHAHRHDCTTASATVHQKTETCSVCAENAGATQLTPILNPKLCQYLVMALAYPISPGCDVSENYV
ncbi:hypothetical protein ISCGN_029090 [Ixodes scapularis]